MENNIFYGNWGYANPAILYINTFGDNLGYRYVYDAGNVKKHYKKITDVLLKHYSPLSGDYITAKNNNIDVNYLIFISREEGIIINIIKNYNENGRISIEARCNKEDGIAINRLLSLIPEMKESRKKIQKINLLVNEGVGFKLKEANLGKIKKNSLMNYPESFTKFHANIVKKLKNKNSGILLLHGEPGTGKTSYIKHLTSVIDRKFVIVPNYMVKELSSPMLVPFLMENPNLILVLEDAEDQVVSRNNSKGGGVAEILNLSDGLIGSALNCSIICTFNTRLENIDSALMRKGRLIGEHKFRKLNVEESNRLLVSLNKPAIAKSAMTLAEVYNMEDELIKEEIKRTNVGFRIGGNI